MNPIQAAAEEQRPTHAACSNCSRMFALLSGHETLCGNCLGALVEDVEEGPVVTPLSLAMQTALASITELRHERDSALRRAEAAEKEVAECRAGGWLPGGLTHGEFQQEVVIAHRLYEKASTERAEAIAKLTSSEQARERAEGLLAEVRRRLDGHKWRDQGHHRESRSVVHAAIQMIDAHFSTRPKDDGHECEHFRMNGAGGYSCIVCHKERP